jgi:glycosyltransferase involved in cell wall biosynthesis
LQSAQAIVVTTSSYATGIVQQHPTLDGKVHAVYLCYDDRQPVQATRPRDPGKVVLLHAGHLHGGVGRNARGLLRALAKTCEIHPGARELIRLELLGAGPGGYEALRTAEDLGIAAMVKVLDEVPPDDCRARMDAADVLVVIKFEDEAFNSQIPGKLFQYFGRGKPILGVMGECEAAEILRRTGLGINAPASDTGALSAAICRLVLNDRGRPPLVPDWSYVRSFSRTAMLNKLAGVLQTACGGIAGGGPEPLRLPGRNTPHACRDS